MLTLALGMGLNTAIFSMVNTLLLPSTPLEREWDLVSLRRTTPENPGRFGMLGVRCTDGLQPSVTDAEPQPTGAPTQGRGRGPEFTERRPQGAL